LWCPIPVSYPGSEIGVWIYLTAADLPVARVCGVGDTEMKMAVEASGVPRVSDRTENLPRSHLGANRKVLGYAPEMGPVVTNAVSTDQADVETSTRRRVVDSRVPTVGST
jgi:hypothetical protein